MANDTADSYIENDFLENRLREASAEDSGRLLEEFVKAFCLNQPEASGVGCSDSEFGK